MDFRGPLKERRGKINIEHNSCFIFLPISSSLPLHSLYISKDWTIFISSDNNNNNKNWLPIVLMQFAIYQCEEESQLKRLPLNSCKVVIRSPVRARYRSQTRHVDLYLSSLKTVLLVVVGSTCYLSAILCGFDILR